jgi:hypothetical protein
MNLRLVASCGLACAVLVLAGCDDGRQAPPKVLVRVANVAPGFAELTFRREQDSRNAATMQFKSTQEFVYDVDTYDFFVTDRTLTPDVRNREWTFATPLNPDNIYLLALTEVGADVRPMVVELPTAPPADAQFIALHAATGQPAMDLYLERPGVGIAGATPRGTFGAQEQIPRSALASGDYELTLTAAGEPSTVLLTSQTINVPATSTAAFIVVPEGGQGTEEISVMMLVQGSAVMLYSTDSTSALRVINGATDRVARDFAIDSQFSPPLFSAAPFGEPTAYAAVPVRSDVKINVTPVGNPGVLELDQNFVGLAAQRSTLLFAGPPGTLTHFTAFDDGRRFHTEAKLRFANAAPQFASGMDLVLTNPGVDPNVVAPLASLLAGSLSSYVALPPGDFDLYLRDFATLNILAGPLPVTFAAGGIYGVLAVDGPDTATAEPLLFDDFP